MIRCSSQTVQIMATAAILAWGLAPGRLASGMPGRLRESMRNNQLSQADYEKMERGYYEELLDAGRKLGAPAVDSDLAQRGGAKVKAVPFEGGPLALGVPDLREFVLKPNLSVDHAGAKWTTNAFGMRDRPYESSKPPNTLRIAFVGDSIGAGWGVGDGQAFESVLERKLDEQSRAAGGPAVEILNFAVPGHGPGQRWEHFSRVGWATEPDLVLFETTEADLGWDERRLRGLLPRGLGWDSPMYRDVLKRAKARPGGTMESYKPVLRPYREEFAAGVFRSAAATCRERGVPIVMVVIPRVGKAAGADEIQRLIAMGRNAEFSSVIDLSDTYRGIDPAALAVGPNDYHPNARGHAMLAERLHTALQRLPNGRLSLTSRSEAEGEQGRGERGGQRP